MTNFEKPRMTVAEIKEENEIVRRGFEKEIGAPLPIPGRNYEEVRQAARNDDKVQYIEHRIAAAVKLFKGRAGSKAKFLNQRDRDEWWSQYEYARDQSDNSEEVTMEQAEDFVWDAYCVLIGIPAASRIGNMFKMLPPDKLSPKFWSFEQVASVTTGKILTEDLQGVIEFVMWYAGGWPDTFAGELDKNKAHKLLMECAAIHLQAQAAGKPYKLPKPEDVTHINPSNRIITLPAFLSQHPAKIKLHPANFTELMRIANEIRS